MKRVKSTVICNVGMRIKCNSVWSDDTTLEQIVKQAKDQIPQTMDRIIEGFKDLTIELFNLKPVNVVLEDAEKE